MTAFYGTVAGQRGEATRLGHSSIQVCAASWHGAIRVTLQKGHTDKDPQCIVSLVPWKGVGDSRLIYNGPLKDIGREDTSLRCSAIDAAMVAGYTVHPFNAGWRFQKPNGTVHHEVFNTPSAAWRAAIMCL